MRLFLGKIYRWENGAGTEVKTNWVYEFVRLTKYEFLPLFFFLIFKNCIFLIDLQVMSRRVALATKSTAR